MSKKFMIIIGLIFILMFSIASYYILPIWSSILSQGYRLSLGECYINEA